MQTFDIFLCYKQVDKYGISTLDSILAQDIYSHLQYEGYNVFSPHITPGGTSALHSAKILLVVGMKAEHFQDAAVRNEWEAFLALAKTDKTKQIILCYRDIGAHELPKELSAFQRYDMSGISFLPSLLHCIGNAVTKTPVSKQTPPQTPPAVPKRTPTPTPTFTPSSSASPEDLALELLRSGYRNKKIEAIKIIRDKTNLSLKDAKAVIDRVFGR